MILAATGHRPNKLGGHGDPQHKKLVGIAECGIKMLEPEHVITGMALGWDIAVAEAAHNLGCPYLAAVPFDGQEAIWPEASQDRYFDLLSKASRVHYVYRSGYAVYKLLGRNTWMVDRADHILAMYDGSEGGTADAMKKAARRGLPITNLWKSYDPS